MPDKSYITEDETPDNIWFNDQDGSVIFTTSPTQSEHSVHKYRSISEAIFDLEGIISGLLRRIPLEDQPDNYGTLVAESVDNEILRQRLVKNNSVLIKRERTSPKLCVYRECDESGTIIKPGRKMILPVRFDHEFLDHIRDFPQQDAEYLLLNINVAGPAGNDSSTSKTTDIKES